MKKTKISEHFIFVPSMPQKIKNLSNTFEFDRVNSSDRQMIRWVDKFQFISRYYVDRYNVGFRKRKRILYLRNLSLRVHTQSHRVEKSKIAQRVHIPNNCKRNFRNYHSQTV